MSQHVGEHKYARASCDLCSGAVVCIRSVSLRLLSVSSRLDFNPVTVDLHRIRTFMLRICHGTEYFKYVCLSFYDNVSLC